MTKDEALKLALEALSKVGYVPDAVNPHPISIAITAIQEALAQPEPGGVCVRCGGWVCDPIPELAQPEPVIDKSAAIRIATTLGWEPKRKPLTDEELYKVFPAIATYTEANKTLYRSIARAIEAAHGIKENT